MAKLNQFQKGVLRDALTMYADALKQEIIDAEAAGKRPFMTQGFVDMQINELLGALKVVSETKTKTPNNGYER
jgi:hypothetical protein